MKKICEVCKKEYITKHKNQKCCSNKCSAKLKQKDLTGQRFGRLTVLNYHHKSLRNNSKSYKRYWLCKCDCGNECIILQESLLYGKTKSCGCLQRENRQIIHKKHGKCNTRLYRIWTDIKSRCYNKNEISYKWYGNKGIKMCSEWEKDFINFYNWAMNNGYSDDLTIDRIDINGNYESNNCRWTTVKKQAQNRTSSKMFTINGETHCIKEWAEIFNKKYNCVIERLKRGWDIEKALYTPVQKQKSKLLPF